jgi:hypothetical protein
MSGFGAGEAATPRDQVPGQSDRIFRGSLGSLDRTGNVA